MYFWLTLLLTAYQAAPHPVDQMQPICPCNCVIKRQHKKKKFLSKCGSICKIIHLQGETNSKSKKKTLTHKLHSTTNYVFEDVQGCILCASKGRKNPRSLAWGLERIGKHKTCISWTQKAELKVKILQYFFCCTKGSFVFALLASPKKWPSIQTQCSSLNCCSLSKVRKKRRKKSLIFCQYGQIRQCNFILDTIGSLKWNSKPQHQPVAVHCTRLGPNSARPSPDPLSSQDTAAANGRGMLPKVTRRTNTQTHTHTEQTNTTVCLLWGQKGSFKAGDPEGDLGGSSKPHLSLWLQHRCMHYWNRGRKNQTV